MFSVKSGHVSFHMSAKDVLWLFFFLAVATTYSMAVGTNGKRPAKRARTGAGAGTMESFFGPTTAGVAPAPSPFAQPQRVRSFTALLVSPTIHMYSFRWNIFVTPTN